jgi:hypothetical protein
MILMTLGRFRALADSYGADLQRWPEDEREAAWALLRNSPEAHALLGDASALDKAFAAASAREQAMLWEPDGPDAALARLRSGVAARLTASAVPRRRWWPGWRPAAWETWVARVGVVSVAASGALAIAAGLLIGTIYDTRPAPNNLLTMLQPAPIHLLQD